MNRIQAVDAANVIMHIRPDWQQAGIVSVLLQLDMTYSAAVLHSVKVAANPNSRTPGAITAAVIPPPPDTMNADIARLAAVDNCLYCDHRGYLRNGAICHHEPPEVAAERAHRGAALARAALDLAAESPPRLELDEQEAP